MIVRPLTRPLVRPFDDERIVVAERVAGELTRIGDDRRLVDALVQDVGGVDGAALAQGLQDLGDETALRGAQRCDALRMGPEERLLLTQAGRIVFREDDFDRQAFA